MTKEEIFEYVMNTPHNTNPAILKDMLERLDGGEGGDGPVIWDLDLPTEADTPGTSPETCRYIRNCTVAQFTEAFGTNHPGGTILRDTHLMDGKTVYAAYQGSGSSGTALETAFAVSNGSRVFTYRVNHSPWTHDGVTDLVVFISN